MRFKVGRRYWLPRDGLYGQAKYMEVGVDDAVAMDCCWHRIMDEIPTASESNVTRLVSLLWKYGYDLEDFTGIDLLEFSVKNGVGPTSCDMLVKLGVEDNRNDVPLAHKMHGIARQFERGEIDEDEFARLCRQTAIEWKERM